MRLTCRTKIGRTITVIQVNYMIPIETKQAASREQTLVMQCSLREPSEPADKK